MRKINLLKIIFSVVVFPMMILLAQRIFAIGQMTKPIVFENVLRGQTVEAILILDASTLQEMNYGLEATGEIKGWAKFYLPDNLEKPITQLRLPAGARVNVIVQFEVPKDTPNGTYRGSIGFFSLPEKEKKEGITASVGERIDREVSITVTDKEVLKFEAMIIPLKYVLGKNEPLKIKVIYDNQGNVYIKPDLQLKITQISTGKIVHNAIYPYPEVEKPVKPFERREFPNLIEWQTAGQENGKYRADIKVLLNGKVMEEESFRFDVGVDIWALLMAAILPAITKLGGGNLLFGWFVLGGIFLVLAGILAFYYKKPEIFKLGINKIKNLF